MGGDDSQPRGDFKRGRGVWRGHGLGEKNVGEAGEGPLAERAHDLRLLGRGTAPERGADHPGFERQPCPRPLAPVDTRGHRLGEHRLGLAPAPRLRQRRRRIPARAGRVHPDAENGAATRRRLDEDAGELSAPHLDVVRPADLRFDVRLECGQRLGQRHAARQRPDRRRRCGAFGTGIDHHAHPRNRGTHAPCRVRHLGLTDDADVGFAEQCARDSETAEEHRGESCVPRQQCRKWVPHPGHQHRLTGGE